MSLAPPDRRPPSQRGGAEQALELRVAALESLVMQLTKAALAISPELVARALAEPAPALGDHGPTQLGGQALQQRHRLVAQGSGASR